MTYSAAPVQDSELVFLPCSQRQDISVGYHYVMIRPVLARCVPR
jgi:hypothetical protein